MCTSLTPPLNPSPCRFRHSLEPHPRVKGTCPHVMNCYSTRQRTPSPLGENEPTIVSNSPATFAESNIVIAPAG